MGNMAAANTRELYAVCRNMRILMVNTAAANTRELYAVCRNMRILMGNRGGSHVVFKTRELYGRAARRVCAQPGVCAHSPQPCEPLGTDVGPFAAGWHLFSRKIRDFG
jgi:hypothetical protein